MTPCVITLSVAVALAPAIEVNRLEALDVTAPVFAPKVLFITPQRMR